jgi:hypothetical protein
LKWFIVECNNPDSDIARKINERRLFSKAELNVSLMDAAKASSASAKDFKKAMDQEKLETMMQDILPGFEEFKKQRGTLKSYSYHAGHYQMLQDWILTGKPLENASESVQEYWKRLKIVRDIANDFRARAHGNDYIINLVREAVGCSESHAYVLVREAASFFSISEPKIVWYNRLLANLDKLFYLAVAEDRELAMKIIEKQFNIVKEIQDSTELPAELYEGRTIITSHKPEDFGMEPISREKLLGMMYKWKLDKEQKERLMLDADIKKNEENIS